ncbi:response regulator transcription factor [Allokutzneria sp. NRRL B-24872]|uniref:response regulator transcription factor n=1 Tax=Allokutzneria sp. NRRL B-24872 TaxID=1137961 RepID=UPI000A3D02F8|nr:response regulator transcription factor [Allokutzneria sp. NRRL B-24872]
MRVVIAEDAVLFREGLVQLLGQFGHEVVAAVGDGPSLVEAVDRLRPDVSVVDVRMPPGYAEEGLRAALDVRERHPGAAVVVLSQYVAHRRATELLESGTAGIGYLLKDRVGDVTEFVDSLRRVAEGGTVMDPEVVSTLLRRKKNQQPLDRLTPREREVLGQLAQGRTNAGAARVLSVSDAAIAKHVNSIFAKLGLEQTPDDHRRVLAVLAYLQG